MPVRTYTALDLINYINGYTSGPSGIDTPSVNHISEANVSISVSGNHTVVSPSSSSATAGAAFIYQVNGDLDFDIVPSIPDNALITEIEYKFEASVSGSATGSASGADLGSGAATGRANLLIYFDNLSPSDPTRVEFDFDDSTGAIVPPASASGAGSDSDSYSRTTTIDLSGSPITKAELVATYSNIIISLQSIAGGGICGFGSGSAISGPLYTFNATADLLLTLTNFQIIITYASGPELVMSPSSGDVEPGQSLNVNGSNAGRMNYAATGVNRVSPIVPKIVDEDTVILPVPLPPTDECSDCLADCPECEECFDACNEDLNSENCQQCLDTCLGCLEDCLEDLEEAEACQQSTQDPPEVPLVIIFGDPTGTQFTGSVPLGTLDVIVANATGIYRLVVGKTNDTLYATVRDGSTYDVAIPIPRAKTGFFRS